jgi:hypothetical protein
MLILRRETAQEKEIPHQNAALGVGTTQWRQGIGDNEALGLIDYSNSFYLDEQVFLKEALLQGGAGRAWGLEIPSVDLVEGRIKGPLAGAGRTTVLGEESPHLDHVLQAPSQELQSSRHIGDGLLGLSHHIGPPGRIPGQPPLGIKSHGAMQENHVPCPHSVTVGTIDGIKLLSNDDLLCHGQRPSYSRSYSRLSVLLANISSGLTWRGRIF